MRARAMGLVVTAALTVAVLTACPPPADQPQNGNTQLPAVGEPDSALVTSAARNAPRAGSVTQGSRDTGGTTADRVSWAGDGVLVQGMRLTEDVTAAFDPESGLRYYTDSGRNAVAAVATGITSGSGARARFDATDPVVFGPWMYHTGNDFVWGMFADGLQADESSGIPGTYRGTTIGVYTDAEDVVDFFIAQVELTLAAGGSVTGTIDEVRSVLDGSPVVIPGNRIPTVVLETTVSSGGLRNGDTAFELNGARQPDADGKWGVTFYDGGEAAGTWGVTNGSDGAVVSPRQASPQFSVVGAFRAMRP